MRQDSYRSLGCIEPKKVGVYRCQTRWRHPAHGLWSVVIKTISPSLSKKNIKTKRTKNRDQKWPNHDAYNTQMNIHEHWSQRPIRRGVPIGDDRQAPGWRQYDREESQRRTHIHAQTQDHMEQTTECCHRGITTNRHTIYLEMSNRIHPVQGGSILPCIPFPSFFSFISESCRQGLLYI